MSAENRRFEAARAIIQYGGKVMLGKREHGVGANQFALIGGGPKGEETREETVVREVLEETGLKFEEPVLWREVVDSESIPGEEWHISFFTGNISGEIRLKKDEVTEVVYVDSDGLGELDIAFNHKEILTEFFEERNRTLTH